MKTCIRQTTIITFRDGEPAVLADHSVVFVDGVITEVGPSSDIDGAFRGEPDTEQIDGAGHLVVPGFINTHHHLYQSLTRCLPEAQNVGLFDWLTALYARWRHLNHESVRQAARVSIAELLLSGCTTTSDHFYLFPQGSDVRMESVLESADEMGIRIHACRGSMSVGQSRGGLPPDDCTELEVDILKDYDRVVDAYHDPDPFSMRRIDLAHCSPFSISSELLKDTARYGRSKKLLLHTHAAETGEEEEYCRRRFHMRPVQYLMECGWLGHDVYLAHCVHLSEQEIADIVSTRTGVAHCPCSNMRLGSGTAPVAQLLRQGAKVGLAVDGSSSNDGGHLLGEARQALLLQRVLRGARSFRPADAFKMATTGGASVLNRRRLGRIELGYAADLTMYRIDDIALAGAATHDPLGALMLCRVGRADRVIVKGKTVVRDGHLVHFDERKLAADLNQTARHFAS
jgi:cytosine/adenosine deaminase-related metal-dependent hydrolase